jgi:protein-tyrosine phosphatase
MKILIDDIPSAQIYPHLDTAVDFISEAVNQGGNVLVHW